MKEYKKEIGGVEVIYTLMDRKLRLKAKQEGISIAALQQGKKTEETIDFIFENCVKNADDCDNFTLAEEAEVMTTVISASYNVEDKASKN